MTTFDQFIAEKLNSWAPGGWPWGNLILCAIAILLCIILCGMVGFEREKRGRSAGLRTHLLVGIGSCIIMIISIYGFPQIFVDHRDVARLAAGVLAGVGFLGAGTIIHFNGSIKGLTTAGTIWLSMAIGLACGSFNFILAIGATIVVMIVLILFRKMEIKVAKYSPTLIILTKDDIPVMTFILNYAKDHEYVVKDIRSQMVKNGDDTCIETTFRLTAEKNNAIDGSKVEEELMKLTNAISIQIVNRH